MVPGWNPSHDLKLTEHAFRLKAKEPEDHFRLWDSTARDHRTFPLRKRTRILRYLSPRRAIRSQSGLEAELDLAPEVVFWAKCGENTAP